MNCGFCLIHWFHHRSSLYLFWWPSIENLQSYVYQLYQKHVSSMLLFQLHPCTNFFLLQNANSPPKQFIQTHEMFLELILTSYLINGIPQSPLMKWSKRICLSLVLGCWRHLVQRATPQKPRTVLLHSVWPVSHYRHSVTRNTSPRQLNNLTLFSVVSWLKIRIAFALRWARTGNVLTFDLWSTTIVVLHVVNYWYSFTHIMFMQTTVT